MRETKDELFIRLTFEMTENGGNIERFADKEGNITLVRDRNMSLYWIIRGRVAETHDGKLDYSKSSEFMIGRHGETLKEGYLSRSNIKELIGKTTINEYAEELRRLYVEFGKTEIDKKERSESRETFLRYYRESKEAEKSLRIKSGEDIFGYAERLGGNKEYLYIRKYHDLLDRAMEEIKNLGALCILISDDYAKRIYERTTDRIVSETLNIIRED